MIIQWLKIVLCGYISSWKHCGDGSNAFPQKNDSVINVKVEFGESEGKVPSDDITKRAEAYKPKEGVTYKMIKEYIETKCGFKVHATYIVEIKKDLS